MLPGTSFLPRRISFRVAERIGIETVLLLDLSGTQSDK